MKEEKIIIQKEVIKNNEIVLIIEKEIQEDE